MKLEPYKSTVLSEDEFNEINLRISCELNYGIRSKALRILNTVPKNQTAVYKYVVIYMNEGSSLLSKKLQEFYYVMNVVNRLKYPKNDNIHSAKLLDSMKYLELNDLDNFIKYYKKVPKYQTQLIELFSEYYTDGKCFNTAKLLL